MSAVLPKSLLKLISEFEKLPGVGPKSAARMAYFLLRAPESESIKLARAAEELKSILTCKCCFNVSDKEICDICSDGGRDSAIICVVEEPLDVVAIEKSGYNGKYHVLGGVISPVNGIGPAELRIDELLKRLEKDSSVKEVILGTNPNMEGEATAMYIANKVRAMGESLCVSRPARGLPTGADLEYADTLTLKKSMEGRLDF